MSFFNRNKSGNKTNKKVSTNPFAKPATKNGNEDQAGGNEPGKQTAAPTNQQQSSEERQRQVREFMKKSGLYEGIDMEGFMSAVRDGDAEKAGAIFARAMENSVNVATVAAQRLVKQREDVIREELSASTQAEFRNDLAVQQLHEDLPFTAQEAVSPIAEDVLNGFLAQGIPVRDAIEKTGQYFRETAEAAGSHFGMEMKEPSDRRPGPRPFSDTRGRVAHSDNIGGEPGEEDWVDVLTFGNQTADSPAGGEGGDGGGAVGGDGNAAAAGQ